MRVDAKVDLSILVLSCDKYSDLWPIFFCALKKNWPDCPFPISLSTGFMSYPVKNIRTLHYGDDVDWSTNVLKSLEAIESSHVLILLEDFILRSPVNSRMVELAWRECVRRNAGLIRLIPNPPLELRPRSIVQEVPSGTPYRVNLQGSIWRKDFLRNLLLPGESAWQFEVNGTRRSNGISTEILSTKDHVLTYRHHVVEKGRWFRWDFISLNPCINGRHISKRHRQSPLQSMVWLLKKIKSISHKYIKIAC
jgi:hypothetical protein